MPTEDDPYIASLKNEIERLRATNTRLNRRCQLAESQVVEYRRRYTAASLPLSAAHEVANRLVEKLRQCYDSQRDWIEKPWRRCWWCRLRRTIGLRRRR